MWHQKIVPGTINLTPSLKIDRKVEVALCHRALEDDTHLGRPQDIPQEEPDTHPKDEDFRKAAELNSRQAAGNILEKRNPEGRFSALEALVIKDMPHTRI